jgi:hypothetical protein
VDIVREPAWQRTLDGDLCLDILGIYLDGYGTETAYRVGTGFRNDDLLGRGLYSTSIVIVIIIVVIAIHSNRLDFIIPG